MLINDGHCTISKIDSMHLYHKDEMHTFLLEGEILRQMPAFVISTQHKQRRWVNDFQSPQIQHTLQHSKHTETDALFHSYEFFGYHLMHLVCFTYVVVSFAIIACNSCMLESLQLLQQLHAIIAHKIAHKSTPLHQVWPSFYEPNALFVAQSTLPN